MTRLPERAVYVDPSVRAMLRRKRFRVTYKGKLWGEGIYVLAVARAEIAQALREGYEQRHFRVDGDTVRRWIKKWEGV